MINAFFYEDIHERVLSRALILNGIGGVAFGWLYWKIRLEFAMMARFSADVIIHGLLRFLV